MAFVRWTKLAVLVALAAAMPQTAIAQQAAPAAPESTVTTPVESDVTPGIAPPVTPATGEDALVSSPAGATAPAGDASYTPMAPTPGKGMPVNGGVDYQDQYSDLGEYAYWLDTYVLLPIIVFISLFVLGLMLWVMARYNARANTVPSKVTHNSFIEVVWTLVPVLILVGIAVPSIDLLAKQYKTAPADAVTVKVTGYQWYWGYSYPDNGDIEVVSNMLSEEDALARGEPFQLAVDNRMVVPAGEPIRVIVTGADVIHSFAVPSLWFKMDAVPGRLNEKMMTINEPGVYYGQCSELCGARHGFMPIAVEALPRPQFDAWVRSQGGTVAGDAVATETETPAEDAAGETAALSMAN
jgi:cytochrome c oxidase subunit 2